MQISIYTDLLICVFSYKSNSTGWIRDTEEMLNFRFGRITTIHHFFTFLVCEPNSRDEKKSKIFRTLYTRGVPVKTRTIIILYFATLLKTSLYDSHFFLKTCRLMKLKLLQVNYITYIFIHSE